MSPLRIQELRDEIGDVWTKVKQNPSSMNKQNTEREILQDLKLTNPRQWTRWGAAFIFLSIPLIASQLFSYQKPQEQKKTVPKVTGEKLPQVKKSLKMVEKGDGKQDGKQNEKDGKKGEENEVKTEDEKENEREDEKGREQKYYVQMIERYKTSMCSGKFEQAEFVKTQLKNIMRELQIQAIIDELRQMNETEQKIKMRVFRAIAPITVNIDLQFKAWEEHIFSQNWKSIAYLPIEHVSIAKLVEKRIISKRIPFKQEKEFCEKYIPHFRQQSNELLQWWVAKSINNPSHLSASFATDLMNETKLLTNIMWLVWCFRTQQMNQVEVPDTPSQPSLKEKKICVEIQFPVDVAERKLKKLITPNVSQVQLVNSLWWWNNNIFNLLDPTSVEHDSLLIEKTHTIMSELSFRLQTPNLFYFPFLPLLKAEYETFSFLSNEKNYRIQPRIQQKSQKRIESRSIQHSLKPKDKASQPKSQSLKQLPKVTVEKSRRRSEPQRKQIGPSAALSQFRGKETKDDLKANIEHVSNTHNTLNTRQDVTSVSDAKRQQSPSVKPHSPHLLRISNDIFGSSPRHKPSTSLIKSTNPSPSHSLSRSSRSSRSPRSPRSSRPSRPSRRDASNLSSLSLSRSDGSSSERKTSRPSPSAPNSARSSLEHKIATSPRTSSTQLDGSLKRNIFDHSDDASEIVELDYDDIFPPPSQSPSASNSNELRNTNASRQSLSSFRANDTIYNDMSQIPADWITCMKSLCSVFSMLSSRISHPLYIYQYVCYIYLDRLKKDSFYLSPEEYLIRQLIDSSIAEPPGTPNAQEIEIGRERKSNTSEQQKRNQDNIDKKYPENGSSDRKGDEKLVHHFRPFPALSFESTAMIKERKKIHDLYQKAYKMGFPTFDRDDRNLQLSLDLTEQLSVALNIKSREIEQLLHIYCPILLDCLVEFYACFIRTSFQNNPDNEGLFLYFLERYGKQCPFFLYQQHPIELIIHKLHDGGMIKPTFSPKWVIKDKNYAGGIKDILQVMAAQNLLT